LEAAFLIAAELGSLNFSFALRHWSEVAGQGFEVIRANRDLLRDLGWLHRNPNDRLGRTARYRLRVPPTVKRGNTSHIHSHPGRYECGNPEDRAWLAHDAWRPGALGDLGWYVLWTVRRPMHASELSIRTGLSEELLADLVPSLESVGLIVTTGDLVARATDILSALDQVAAGAGTQGQADADRSRHQEERVAFRTRRGVNSVVSPKRGRPRDQETYVALLKWRSRGHTCPRLPVVARGYLFCGQ
jgi:hypothetical protein